MTAPPTPGSHAAAIAPMTDSLSPRQLREWYRFPPFTGKGQRIALLEFGAGYYESDLVAALAMMGVARTAMPVFRGVPAGMSEFATPPSNFPLDTRTIGAILDDFAAGRMTELQIMTKYTPGANWEQFLRTLEATQDVQAVCALAPDADVRVYLAPPEGDAALVQALRAALDDDGGPPTVVCISWGVSEDQWLGAYDNPADDSFAKGTSSIEAVNFWLERARTMGVTVCCASGDFGSRDRGPDEVPGDDLARVNFPASSPHVLAVGGTALVVERGVIAGETAWNTAYDGVHMAGGGGMSGCFARPDWQLLSRPTSTVGIWQARPRAQFDGRWLPDVAAHADRAHGLGIVLGGRAFVGDGTSMAVPIWGALLACIAEGLGHLTGWLGDRLYQPPVAATFRDITSGTNQVDADRKSFSAAVGWDPVTGMGAPDGQALLAALQAPRATDSAPPTSA
jgi:kumamolisin